MTKTGPAAMSTGQLGQFGLDVQNTGVSDAWNATINDNIKITILGVSGMQVRIGIEAPDHITVHRQEIWHRIRDEKDGQGK